MNAPRLYHCGLTAAWGVGVRSLHSAGRTLSCLGLLVDGRCTRAGCPCTTPAAPADTLIRGYLSDLSGAALAGWIDHAPPVHAQPQCGTEAEWSRIVRALGLEAADEWFQAVVREELSRREAAGQRIAA